MRLSAPGPADAQLGVRPDPVYGDQFNTAAVQGVRPEGRVEIRSRALHAAPAALHAGQPGLRPAGPGRHGQPPHRAATGRRRPAGGHRRGRHPGQCRRAGRVARPHQGASQPRLGRRGRRRAHRPLWLEGQRRAPDRRRLLGRHGHHQPPVPARGLHPRADRLPGRPARWRQAHRRRGHRGGGPGQRRAAGDRRRHLRRRGLLPSHPGPGRAPPRRRPAGAARPGAVRPSPMRCLPPTQLRHPGRALPSAGQPGRGWPAHLALHRPAAARHGAGPG